MDSSNNKNFKESDIKELVDNFKNIPLVLNKSNSTSNFGINNNRNIKKIDNDIKRYSIPENRMEQYVNEYYTYLYSTKNSEKENTITYTNVTNINTKANKLSTSNLLSPIERIKFKENNNSNNNFQMYNGVFPDDLLIEYNNKKRLNELRNKYLSNSSLHFLRKKDDKQYGYNFEYNNRNINGILNEKINSNENNINNIILDLKLNYEKLQNELNVLKNNKNEIINNNNENNKDNNNINYENNNIKVCKVKDNNKNDKDIYYNYIIEENNKLKKINKKYEIILELLISYINETNKYFHYKQIDYFNLKQNIFHKKTKCIKELSNFIDICKKDLDIKMNLKSFHFNKPKENNKNKYLSINNSKKNEINKTKEKDSYINKKRNKMRYTLSTVSFRNKFCNSSMETIDLKHSRTMSKFDKGISKNKNKGKNKTRINLVKNKK